MLSKSLSATGADYAGAAAPRSWFGMSGRPAGTTGRAAWTSGYAVTLALLALVCVVNIASTWHDRAPGTPLWRPVLGEASSIAAVAAFAWIAFAARDAARGLSFARAAALHAAAACAFSSLHCLLMWTLRWTTLALCGLPYGWMHGPGQFFYEFRKDVVTYAVLSLVYRGVTGGSVLGKDAVPSTKPQREAAACYTVRDGSKVWRLDPRDIAAIMSAGNYVEFLLGGGQRILARATLSGVCADLAAAGFLRVHRSWVVNAVRVRALSPDQAGDYTLMMEGGLSVPLSRRFPEALARLRQEK